MTGVSRILLPTAFAVLSKRAAEYVKLFMPALGAELHVVHVVPDSTMMVDPGVPGGGSLPIDGPAPSELLADARDRLSAFVREVLPGLEPRVTTTAVMGNVVDELLRYAREHRIDLIVMGTHADSALKRIIWGSVGKSVLEGSPCPIMLVPARDAPRV